MTAQEFASPVLADLHQRHKERQERIKAAAIKELTQEPIRPIAAPAQEPVPETAPVEGNSIPRYKTVFELILSEVCTYFKVRKEDILSDRRLNYISSHRHLLAYMMYLLTDYTSSQIGTRMGRDYTTINYAIKKIRSNLPLYRKDIEELEAIIRPLLPPKRK